jgi:hypothetical protein
MALLGLAARERREGGPGLEARLREVFALSRETGYRAAFYLDPEELSDLCAAALSMGIEKECVRAYVSANGLAPPPWARDLEAWPWAVSIRVLGEYQVTVGEEPLSASADGSRALDLLAALVAHGGEVTVNTLLDALWPHAEGDRAHHALETTLYRLRKLLGPRVGITQHEGVVALDPRTCFTDLRALRKRMEQVAALCERDTVDGEALLGEAERLVALYRGPFLPLFESSWAEATRRGLRVGMARQLRSAERALVRAGLGVRAQILLDRALLSDPDLPVEERSSS